MNEAELALLEEKKKVAKEDVKHTTKVTTPSNIFMAKKPQ